MFNNPVLDIAIGLVFIFLLYSLLATTIKELLATIFSYRPRMLEIAIERMLDGEKKSYYWFDKLLNVFLWLIQWVNFQLRSKTVGYKKWKKNKKDKGQTNLKNGDDRRRTDVQQADSMDNTADIKSYNLEKTNGKPKMVSMKNFLANKPLPVHQKLRRHKLNKKSSFFANNFTNHPLYLRAAEDTLFNKKPAYLTAKNFSDILTDILSPGDGKPFLMNDIFRKVTSMPDDGDGCLSPGTKKILKIYINQANGDMQRFKILLEDWYNDTMNRVSGWYKRQAYKILMVIGLVLAVVFNVNTIKIVDKLSNDKTAREAMVKSASTYIHENTMPTSPDTKDKNKDYFDEKKIKAGIEKINDLYKKQIAQQNTTLGLGWDNEMRDDIIEYEKACALNQIDCSFFTYFVLYKLPAALIGFFITALAISLGAPFWFDLLNKFINLRVNGKRPDDDTSSGSKTASMNQKPLPNSFA